jgi:hypothetical protein
LLATENLQQEAYVMKSILGLLVFLLLVSCSQHPQIQTVEVTRIVQQTVMITQINNVIITATPKPATAIPSPTYTYGPTNTPVPSDTPTPTIDPQIITATAQAVIDLVLKGDHGPGVYLVGIDIAPGVWRSTPGADDCSWKRSNRTGDIIDNYYSFSGGTIYIDPTDFSVELSTECGIWTYLSVP